MTAVQFHHAQTSIEEALSSAQYGERMIRLADQFRREGNHDAADAAFMAAAQIRYTLSAAMELLPIIAPEHAHRLSESQRQRLATQLSESHGHLNRMIEEHDVAEVPLEELDQRCEEWYASCLHIGHMARLARGVAARAAEATPSDDLIEMTEYALSLLHQGAQESMADVRENELPDDAPFPQTRNQLREQAIEDHAEIEETHRLSGERQAAARAEADNSEGHCHICGGSLRADEVRSHAATCFMDAVQRRYRVRDVDQRYARSQPLMVWVRSEELRHWVMLIVQPTTSLRQLDQFLCDLWLECCGHMSHFEIGNIQYSACVPGPGDPPMFDTDLAEPDEQHMIHTVEETIVMGQKFRHEFDYGDTTCLDLELVGALPIPYGYVQEFTNPPDVAQGYHDDFITVVARNLPPERCFTCGAVARWRYHANPYIGVPPEQGGPIVACPTSATTARQMASPPSSFGTLHAPAWAATTTPTTSRRETRHPHGAEKNPRRTDTAASSSTGARVPWSPKKDYARRHRRPCYSSFDDCVDEAVGFITLTVMPGNSYTLGEAVVGHRRRQGLRRSRIQRCHRRRHYRGQQPDAVSLTPADAASHNTPQPFPGSYAHDQPPHHPAGSAASSGLPPARHPGEASRRHDQLEATGQRGQPGPPGVPAGTSRNHHRVR